MDNLTHTLVGLNIAHAGLRRKIGLGTAVILAVSSNLPDIDVFWAFFDSSPSFMYRRMLTHSFLAIPLLTLFWSGIFKLIYKNLSWKNIVGLTLLGMAFHILFDFINSYGVVFFYPISRQRFELAWVFIIDLILWGLLVFPFALYPFFKNWEFREKLSKISLILVGSYILFCGCLRIYSNHLVQKWAQEKAMTTDFAYTFPEPFGPQRFRGVIKNDSTYEVLLVHPLSKKIDHLNTINSENSDPKALQIKTSEIGKKFEWFFKAPVWTRDKENPEGNVWNGTDLRFQSPVLKFRNPFVYQFQIDENGVQFLGLAKK